MSITMPWESTSYYHRFKQSLWLETSPADELLKELTAGNFPAQSTLEKVVAYLADHRHSKLETALAAKFDRATTAQVQEALTSLTTYSFNNGRLRMLNVCERIASLQHFKNLSKVADVPSLAKVDALVTPQPVKRYEWISRQWLLNAGVFGKVAQYFISTATWTYGIDLDTPPTNRWAAQSQWMVFRTIGEDLKWAGSLFLQFFTSTWKASVAALGILASLIGVKYLYHRYRVGVPENLDKKYFRNLNDEARAGRLKKTVGRKAELSTMETCLSTPPGQQPRIPILVGPPGVGKTQLVEGLALNIVNGETARLGNKKVFVINTSNLSEWGNYSEGGYTSRLDMLFQQIVGFEDQVILFFDEAHNAAAGSTQSTGNNNTGMLLEQLKTKLLERKVLCILATTTEEFEEHIAPNKAFTDRVTRIDFPSLSDEETKGILQDKTHLSDENPVEVALDAVDEVLGIAKNHPDHKDRANPRKSTDILQKGINHVYAWTPSVNIAEIERAERAYKTCLTECMQARRNAPGWSLTAADQAPFKSLSELNQALQRLRDERAAELAQFEKVKRLQSLELSYSKREYELIHLLAAETKKPLIEAQKTYLFMQFVVLPLLRKQIVIEAGKLKEKMPLRVDAALIKQLYPA